MVVSQNIPKKRLFGVPGMGDHLQDPDHFQSFPHGDFAKKKQESPFMLILKPPVGTLNNQFLNGYNLVISKH